MPAPPSAESGTSSRWSGPRVSRSRWGTTSPARTRRARESVTAPATLALAVSSDHRRVRATGTPSEEASSSPSVSRLSCPKHNRHPDGHGLEERGQHERTGLPY